MLPCDVSCFPQCSLISHCSFHWDRWAPHLIERHLYLPRTPSYCWRPIGACSAVTSNTEPYYFDYYWCYFWDSFPGDNRLKYRKNNLQVVIMCGFDPPCGSQWICGYDLLKSAIPRSNGSNFS